MKKIYGMKYTDAKGNRKIYSYYITLTKEELRKAGFNPDKELNVVIKDNKIIVSQ